VTIKVAKPTIDFDLTDAICLEKLPTKLRLRPYKPPPTF